VQLAERIFVGKNKQMDMLSRKQTPVYNQALFVLRGEYFWLTHLNPGWRAYYPKITAMRVSFFFAVYPRRIDINVHENRKTSPDIFGWNGAGARHHPQLVSNPAPS
jgi:hypothetical protein